MPHLSNGMERALDVTHQINAFRGTQSIEDLEVFPASFHTSGKDAETKAIARCRQFWELRGVHYKAYSGRINYIVHSRRIERNVSRH